MVEEHLLDHLHGRDFLGADRIEDVGLQLGERRLPGDLKERYSETLRQCDDALRDSCFAVVQRPDQRGDFLFAGDQNEIIHHLGVVLPAPYFGDDQLAFLEELVKGRFLNTGGDHRDRGKVCRCCMYNDTRNEPVIQKILQCVFHKKAPCTGFGSRIAAYTGIIL